MNVENKTWILGLEGNEKAEWSLQLIYQDVTVSVV